MNFRMAPWYEQMYTKAWLKLLGSFAVVEVFNPDVKRGQQSWQAGELNNYCDDTATPPTSQAVPKT